MATSELVFTHVKVQRLAHDVAVQAQAHREAAREEMIKTAVGPVAAACVYTLDRAAALLRGRRSLLPSRFAFLTAAAAALHVTFQVKGQRIERQSMAADALDKVFDLEVLPLVDELYGRHQHEAARLRQLQDRCQAARGTYHQELAAAFPKSSPPEPSATAAQTARFHTSRPAQDRQRAPTDTEQLWASSVGISGGAMWRQRKPGWAPPESWVDRCSRAAQTCNVCELLSWEQRTAYTYHWPSFADARNDWLAATRELREGEQKS